MRIQVTPPGVHVDGARQIGRSSVALYVADRAIGVDVDPNLSSYADLETRLRASGQSYVAVDDQSVRVAADYQGSQQLYVHHVGRASAPSELVITDDPVTFAGMLPIDYDVAKLVPLMKFVPPPLSIVRGAQRLTPGTLYTYDRRTLQPTEQRSFLPELYQVSEQVPAHEDVRETLGAIVAEQTRHLPAPVVFLSGGTDSALLVHLLKSRGTTPTAWTAVFDTPTGRLEGELAASTANEYGVPWHSVMIDRDIVLEQLPAVLACMKEPSADVALMPEAVLALALRRETGSHGDRIAVFEGEGMDSLMCGSYKFVVERYRRLLSPLLALVPGSALSNVDRSSSWGALALKIVQMKTLLEGKEAFERHLRFLVGDGANEVFPSTLRAQVEGAFRAGYDLLPGTEELSRLAMMTFQGNVPNLENRKLQTVSSYADVDFCLTFQDPRFISLAMSAPVRTKIGMGYGKRIVKQAFRRDLPRHTMTRRKASFVPPVVKWVYPAHEDLIFGSELFPHGLIQRCLDEHTQGERDHLPFIWGLLATNAWIQRYKAQAASRDHRSGAEQRVGALAENQPTH